MGDLHLVTGYAGKPHVTAADQASLFMGAIRGDSFVMDAGQNFKAEVITNNLVRIYDGEMVIQGRHVKLETGLYIDVTIENGTQGYLRNDLIVARYAKDSETGVETFGFAVIKGTPAETDPTDPEYATADINEGTLLHEEPMIRVPLDGLNVCELEVLFVPQKSIYASMFHADGSVPMTGPLDMGSNRVKNVAEPEADTDAATLGYARKVGAPYNLLDNSDFRNPVNQRGSTIFQAPNIEYWLDRWVAYGTGSSFTLEEGKVVISSDGTATCGLMQRVSVNSLKAGSKYTLAFKAKVIGAKCYLSYGVNNKDNAASSAALEENVEKIHTFTFTLPEADADSACYNFRIRSSAAEATMEIEWAALYEGEYTAETLPEYQPKGYAAELMECYRYFYKLINKTSSGLLTASGTELRFGVETPIAMRTTPTLSSFEMSGLRTIVNTNIAPAVTDPFVTTVNGNVLALQGTVDLSEYIDSATYINNTPVAAYIGFELSADL